MRFAATFKVLGILLMMFSLSMLPPVAVALWYHEPLMDSFLWSFTITLTTGWILWLFTRSSKQDLKTRDGFLVVVLFWTVLSCFGSIPLMSDPVHTLSLTDAIFESTSGLTTTGATILSHLSLLPRSVLYYRQQLEFLGGMGIIVLAVAILPMLGIGGMQLCRAEIAGPIKNAKLRPRMKETAKALWSIYVGLTIACAFCFWISGMNLFDAITESFGTVSTGGFSTHDSSFEYYHSEAVNLIAIGFMLLGAINFALHFQFMRHRKVALYFKDPELRAYLLILGVVILVTLVTLLFTHSGYDSWHGFINAAFTVVSMSTTTGTLAVNFNQWPTFLPYLMMLMAIVGGCSASTSGGLKVIRLLVVREQSLRELGRLIHPRAVLAIKLGENVLPESILHAVWGFMSVFMALFVLLVLALLAVGLDFETAFSAVAACLSNTGSGLGQVAANFAELPQSCKWILIFAMLAGRLEIFTLLVLFMPSYWKR